jgi:hypothetical protein
MHCYWLFAISRQVAGLHVRELSEDVAALPVGSDRTADVYTCHAANYDTERSKNKRGPCTVAKWPTNH